MPSLCNMMHAALTVEFPDAAVTVVDFVSHVDGIARYQISVRSWDAENVSAIKLLDGVLPIDDCGGTARSAGGSTTDVAKMMKLLAPQ
jgi:hypothetical protein